MIYVLTKDYAVFQSFLHEFHLREHFGNGGNREGQCVYLQDESWFRSVDRGLVLLWGPPVNREWVYAVRERCIALDIPMMEVPDLRRARHHREHPEAFFNPKVPW